VAREHQRVGFAEAERDDRNQHIISHEHHRDRYNDHAGAPFDDFEDFRKVVFMNQYAAAEQLPARKRDVDHCKHS